MTKEHAETEKGTGVISRVRVVICPVSAASISRSDDDAMRSFSPYGHERLLVSDESMRFIAWPRWKTKSPRTSRLLVGIDDFYRIIWSTSDIAMLGAESVSACDDWYCRTEYVMIEANK